MSKWRNPVLLIVLLTRIGSSFCFDCMEVCFHDYTSATSDEIDCELLLNTQTCYNEYQQNCTAYQPRATIHQVRVAIGNRECPVAPSLTPSTDTPTLTTTTDDMMPTFSCPSLSNQSADLLVTEAVIWSEEGVSNGCLMRESNMNLQHCSIFLNGNLRPFKAYHDGLQTCSIPGSWKLFQHDQMEVEVEGNSSGHAHTQLTKISVTLFPASCNDMRTWKYVADSKQALPLTFDGEDSPYVNSNSPLQLHLGSEGNVVTILATWMNATVVIRRLGELLSVTLQVPGLMSFYSEGLCTGCANHQMFDSLSENRLLIQKCFTEATKVLLSCYNVEKLRDLALYNLSYYDACAFSYQKTNSAYVMSMMEAVAMDAKVLLNHGFVPRRPPGATETSTATYPMEKTTTSVVQTSTSPETVTDININTMDDIQIIINFSSSRALNHCSLIYVFAMLLCLS